MADVVALAEALIHPALVATTHVFITVLLISRMVVAVHIILGVLGTAAHHLTLSLISRATIELRSFLLLEVTLLPELVGVLLLLINL